MAQLQTSKIRSKTHVNITADQKFVKEKFIERHESSSPLGAHRYPQSDCVTPSPLAGEGVTQAALSQ